MRYLLAFLLLCLTTFLPPDVRAQDATTIRGEVRDAQTGEPLVAASLLVEGTGRGTITNADGAFALRVDQVPARVLVRYLGYEAAAFDVVAEKSDYAIALNPVALTLEGLVVSAENPAVNIMRRVIAEKTRWRAALDTYRADAYTRLVIRNDTGIVQVEETLTDVFWEKARGMREIVRSRRKSANSTVGDQLPAAALVRNLYDDDIDVAGFTFVGVTHPNALDVYTFTLSGTRELDGQTVYDIAVAPRSAQAVAFVGRVAVLDSVYALLEVELRPGPVFRFPPPIARYEVTFSQQFFSFNTDAWLPIDFRSESILKIRVPGLIELPELTVQQISRVSDYVVGVPVPDSLFERARTATFVDSTALRADTLLDVSGVRVPLSAEEQAALAGIDSTQTLDKTLKPTGVAARFVQVGSDRQARKVEFDFSPAVWYNRVEALHAGGAATMRVRGIGRLGVEAGYETGLQALRYALTGRLVAGRAYLQGLYEKGVAPRYASVVQSRLLNGLDVLLARGDYFDYTDASRVRAALGYRPRRTNWDVQAGFSAERHRPVETVSEILTVQGYRTPRPNPDLDVGRIHSVQLQATWNGAPQGLGIVPQRRLGVGVEQAAGALGSDVTFGRVYGSVDVGIPTLARRRFLPGRLELRLTGQYGWDDVPGVRYGIVEASQQFSSAFGALRTLQPLPYLGASAVALHWEHNFRTLPFEQIGWGWAVRQGYSVLVHGGHARTWASAAAGRETPTGGHHEVGLGLSGLFTYFRLDLTARLDEPAVTVGIAPARFF